MRNKMLDKEEIYHLIDLLEMDIEVYKELQQILKNEIK